MMKIIMINPFPLIISLWIFNFFMSLLYLLIYKLYDMFIISFFYLIFFLKKWWNKIMFESSLMGIFLNNMKIIMKTSFLIFILSEIMLFMSMFWMFLHSSISPDLEIGLMWPPHNFKNLIFPLSLPLVGSFLLLMSGFQITLSHHLILNNNFKNSNFNINLTIMLGLSFLMIQMNEFFSSKFMMHMSLNDSIYANSFFFITSLHGSHVMGGMLFMNYVKNKMWMNSIKNHSNFEMMSWYWHFVDVVWIFVFSLLYWWNMFLFNFDFHSMIN